MRSILFCTIILLLTAAAGAAQSPSPVPQADNGKPAAVSENDGSTAQNGVRPDSKTRFKRYVNGMFGPVAIGKTIASAGWGTWRNSPEEWGDQWEGFGKRVASGFGKSVIKNTTMYALDESLKYDSRFYRSKKKDVGSRLRNAIISPVTARNARGKRVVGIPRITATYTSSIIAAETWYPSRYDYKDGLKSGTISLGITAAFNVFKEFVWK